MARVLAVNETGSRLGYVILLQRRYIAAGYIGAGIHQSRARLYLPKQKCRS